MKWNMDRRGLTLIELLVVLVIIGILVAMAMSSMSQDKDKREFSAAAREILTVLNTGRSAAISSGYNVVVDDGVDANGLTEIQIFRDDDGSWAFEDGKDVMLAKATLAKSVILQASIDPHAFNPRGQVTVQGGGLDALRLTICENLNGAGCVTGSHYVAFFVNLVGVVTSSDGTI